MTISANQIVSSIEIITDNNHVSITTIVISLDGDVIANGVNTSLSNYYSMFNNIRQYTTGGDIDISADWTLGSISVILTIKDIS